MLDWNDLRYFVAVVDDEANIRETVAFAQCESSVDRVLKTHRIRRLNAAQALGRLRQKPLTVAAATSRVAYSVAPSCLRRRSGGTPRSSVVRMPHGSSVIVSV